MLLKLRKIRRRIKDAYNQVRINYLYAKEGVKFRRPKDNEKNLTFSVIDLLSAGYLIEFDERQETWVARAFPSGDFEVRYSYEFEQNNSLARFLMTTRMELAKSVEGAEELFQDAIAARESGLADAGGRFVFKGNLQSWSDNFYGAITLSEPDEIIVGCVLSFQKERLVYTIVLSGVYFEDEWAVEELIYPFLDEALAWSRSDPFGK
jgi:hypothetical protein